MKKQEVIDIAYGNYADIAKGLRDENGWIKSNEYYTYFPQDKEYTPCGGFRRPKSLKGIENNNGWVEIKSEDDLPKENHIEYFVKQKDNEESFILKYSDGVFMSEYKNYEKITHYQPIIKPNNPLY